MSDNKGISKEFITNSLNQMRDEMMADVQKKLDTMRDEMKASLRAEMRDTIDRGLDDAMLRRAERMQRRAEGYVPDRLKHEDSGENFIPTSNRYRPRSRWIG